MRCVFLLNPLEIIRSINVLLRSFTKQPSFGIKVKGTWWPYGSDALDSGSGALDGVFVFYYRSRHFTCLGSTLLRKDTQSGISGFNGGEGRGEGGRGG